MLTNPQIWLVKAAQKQAGLDDASYRACLWDMFQVGSSKDPLLGDEHLDRIMKFFEAIYWRKVDLAEAVAPGELIRAGRKPESLPFRQRDFWKNRNTRQETSRDRFQAGDLAAQITALENDLYQLGCNRAYCSTIRLKVTGGHGTPGALWKYKAALERTVAAKRKKLEEVNSNVPF